MRRAALLLPDYDEDIFVPWASHGLDATSIHRLRIPTADLRVIASQSESGVLWSGESCREFASFFSRREAAMLDHLLLYPFVRDDEVHGALLVTDTPYLEAAQDYLHIILAAVGEPAAGIIRERRAEPSRVLRQSIVFKPAEISIVAERVAGRSPDGVKLIVVELADVVSQVATVNEQLDPYRVWQDVLRATTALFSSTASVCDADEHRALLLLHGRTDVDVDLLIHHIGATLASLLPELAALPVLRFHHAHFPDDGEEIETLINSLL